MKHPFSGTGVALVTPFHKNAEIDYASLKKLVDHVVKGGVDYIVALGTTAETPSLTSNEKLAILDFILNQTSGRVPVVCGIGSNNTQEVLSTIEKVSFLQGLAGFLTVVPYYNKPSQEGIFQHFQAIAEATTKDIILYNVPGRTGTSMTAATCLRLANKYDHIVAVKEASGDLSQCMDLIKGRPDHFAILSGDDDLALAQMALGMDGVISVAANLFPFEFSKMIHLAKTQQVREARTMHYSMLDGIRLLFKEGNPTGVKSALSHLGILENHLRLPLTPASAELHEEIGTFLAGMQGRTE